jgi:hypothetical protein
MLKSLLIWLFAPVRPVRWPTRRRRRNRLWFWGPGQAEIAPAWVTVKV